MISHLPSHPIKFHQSFIRITTSIKIYCHFTTATSPPDIETTQITNLVLNSTPKTLPQILKNIALTPHLVTKVLKNLWNHGPKALQFFAFIEKHHVSSLAFDHAIDIAARLRDYKTVEKLLHRMRGLRLGPTPKTFSIVAERYVSAGKPDRAVRLFLSMHNFNCPQTLESFNTILDVLCKGKRVEKAYSLLRALRGKFRADTISYNIIANGFCLVKQTGKALEVLKEMVERGISPSLNTYNIILKGFFRAGRIDDGWDFFLQMRKRGCEIDVVTYTTLVHGLGVVGEIKRARNVFNEMIGKGVLPSVATYNAFIQVLCKKDSVDSAIVVFEEMLRKGYTPNSITYNVVIRGLCHTGEMSRALEFVDRMKKDECQPNVQTYNLLIRYYCEDGEIDKGLDVFGKMGIEGCLPNLDTYNILITSMFVRKKSEDLLVAGKLLIEMVDRGFMPRRFTFNRVLNGLLLTGNQGFAKEILRLQSKCGRLPRHFRM